MTDITTAVTVRSWQLSNN